jgi:hypothetical protein
MGNSHIVGTVMAYASITTADGTTGHAHTAADGTVSSHGVHGAEVVGRLLAINAAVTFTGSVEGCKVTLPVMLP